MEIGGYFGIDTLTNGVGEYYPDLFALNTARNALVYLLKARCIQKLYLPYYLCDSVSLVCKREGYSYEYYHITENFEPEFDKALSRGEYLYIVNYYGQISNEKLEGYKQKYKNIIVDNVQAFFQKAVDGIDTIYSCRKFMGVPDGAYLATDSILSERLEADKSEDRTSHIYGRAADGASAHYAEFRANDESFKQLPLRRMSSLTHRMLSEIDYEKVKKIRKDNYRYLHQHLVCSNKLELCIPEGPYAYPYYCENGMAIKKKLAERKIYVATLWPNVLEMQGLLEKNYAENILPLPCDQRYGEREMDFVLNSLMTVAN